MSLPTPLSGAHPSTDRAPPVGGRLLAVVFLPFAAAYFASFLFRNVNSVIFPELVGEFLLGPGALGFLTSAYFIGFAGAQLPLGLAMDRYGLRRVNATMLLVAGVGAVIFASARSLDVLVLGRAVIGAGVAVCLMSAMTAFVLWFPVERMASLVGWMLAVGSAGALAATKPVEVALRLIDWRTLFLLLAAYTTLASIAILRFVPEKPAAQGTKPLRVQIGETAGIFRQPVFWRIGLAAALVQSVGIGLLGLWAGPWMRDVAGLDRASLATQLLFAAAAFGVGGLLWGEMSDRLARRGIAPIRTYVAGCSLCALAMLPIIAGWGEASLAIWVVFLGLSPFGTLAYPLFAARFPREMTGRVMTALNMLTFASAWLVQFGVGAIINLWPVNDGRYALAGYQAAFGLCWLAMIGAILYLLATHRGMK